MSLINEREFQKAKMEEQGYTHLVFKKKSISQRVLNYLGVNKSKARSKAKGFAKG